MLVPLLMLGPSAKGDTMRLAGAGEFLHNIEAKMEVALIQLNIYNTLEGQRNFLAPSDHERLVKAVSG